MINQNKVFILGNVTKDPELKTLPSGNKVATFGVATNRVFKDTQGNKKEQVEFHNVVVFGKQAETTAQYMKKGSQILIEGRIQTRNYEKDGVKHYRTEIIAENVQFGSHPAQPTSGSTNLQAPPPVADKPATVGNTSIEYPDDDINAEDIPF